MMNDIIIVIGFIAMICSYLWRCHDGLVCDASLLCTVGIFQKLRRHISKQCIMTHLLPYIIYLDIKAILCAQMSARVEGNYFQRVQFIIEPANLSLGRR